MVRYELLANSLTPLSAAIGVFVIGLIVGSFLGAVVYRVPRGMSMLSPPSTCPACGHRLGVLDLIPVMSYLMARGRCRHCGRSVSWRYTAIELLTGLGFVVINACSDGWEPFIVGCVFYSLLLIMAAIDIEHMLLPDKINAIGIVAGLIVALLVRSEITVWRAIMGAAAGYGVVWMIHVLSRGGMGMGDAKFLAMIGTFIGFPDVLQTLFAASVFGLAFGGVLILAGRHRRGAPLPFGPFLAVGALVVWIYSRNIA